MAPVLFYKYNMNSPSVKIQEIAKTHYVPYQTGEIAAFVGHFEKGPINTPIFITDPDTFKFTFGRGINDSFNDWYQVYNYLRYATGIWVIRAGGALQLNAGIGDPVYFNSLNDFDEAFSELPIEINGFSAWANTAGSMGNILSVSLITKPQYDSNVEMAHGYTGKNVFTYFQDSYYGLCIYRDGKIVEAYHVNLSELGALFNTKYIYIKTETSEILPFYGDGSDNTTGNLAPFQVLSGGIVTFPSFADFSESHDILNSKDDYNIDIIIGNEYVNELAVSVAETRKDCIAFIGLPSRFINILTTHEGDIINTHEGNPILTADTKLNRKLSASSLKTINDYIDIIPESQFVHFTCNMKRQYDGFSDKIKTVNIAGDTAGLKAKASLNRPWAPGAGLENGVILNSEELLLNLSKAEKDTFYRRGLNFVDNSILLSQKTFNTVQSSFNRINTRSLFNHIEKDVGNQLRNYIFKDNSLTARGNIASTVKKLLVDVKANRGIAAGRVEVYPSKTDPTSIIVDIYIKPLYVAEYILLRMSNVGNNTFSEILST